MSSGGRSSRPGPSDLPLVVEAIVASPHLDARQREARQRELQALPRALARDAPRRVRAGGRPLAARARRAARREPPPRHVLLEQPGRQGRRDQQRLVGLAARARPDRPRRHRRRRRRRVFDFTRNVRTRAFETVTRWNALEHQVAGLLEQRRKPRRIPSASTIRPSLASCSTGGRSSRRATRATSGSTRPPTS